MTVPESFSIALYCIVGVFLVLMALLIILMLFSVVFKSFGNKKTAEKTPTGSPEALNLQQPSPAAEFSSGVLKLKDVDEPTAAIIMAIVSDESGIPLSELCFKSIKLLQKA